MAGILTLNIRGLDEVVKVEPTTERESMAPGVGRDTDVISIWGIRYCSCKVVIASFKLSMSTILTPDSVLFPLSAIPPVPHKGKPTQPRIDLAISDLHP